MRESSVCTETQPTTASGCQAKESLPIFNILFICGCHTSASPALSNNKEEASSAWQHIPLGSAVTLLNYCPKTSRRLGTTRLRIPGLSPHGKERCIGEASCHSSPHRLWITTYNLQHPKSTRRKRIHPIDASLRRQ